MPVYAFDDTTYTGYSGTTDIDGEVEFILPMGDYRFRSDLNGTHFWSGEANHCTVPGCTEASVTVTIPVAVTVETAGGSPQAGVPVYAFDGGTYTGYHGTTDEDGEVILTLPVGDYRFRADVEGVQYWSGEANHCTVPGCTSATVIVPAVPGEVVSTTIDYSYDPLYRLTAADYSSGEYFHYTYDAVGNPPTAGTPMSQLIVNQDVNFDAWTVIHELGHAWDYNSGGSWSRGLEEYTEGSTSLVGGVLKLWLDRCDPPNYRLPGCNAFGYFYGGIPPKGSDVNFNREEDFAESVAAYVFPVEAQKQVAEYLGTEYEDFLYYLNYRDTPRWDYVNGLINGTISVP